MIRFCQNQTYAPCFRFAALRVFEAKITYTLVSLGEPVSLSKPTFVAEYLRSAFDEHPTQEAFYAVYLNRRNRPLGRHLITLGTLTSTLVSPREVFRGAILASASALVVAHNHPSGDPSPSRNDLSMTRQLLEASKIMDIELLDHVIVGSKEGDPQGTGLFSFREAGIL